MNGYNPMRWNCTARGCFNQKMRPKIEVFHDLFPGNINFGDIDAEVEINGHLLRLEWKSAPMTIPKGQAIMFGRVTVGLHISVLCVAGNAETMTVTHLGWFRAGRFEGWDPGTLNDVRLRISKWVTWAHNTPSLWHQLVKRIPPVPQFRKEAV